MQHSVLGTSSGERHTRWLTLPAGAAILRPSFSVRAANDVAAVAAAWVIAVYRRFCITIGHLESSERATLTAEATVLPTAAAVRATINYKSHHGRR